MAKAKPRRGPRRRQPSNADPVLSLAIRCARAIGTHLAVWLAHSFAIGLLPLRVFGAACVVFITSFVSEFWREASEIRKEKLARMRTNSTAQSKDRARKIPPDDQRGTDGGAGPHGAG